MSLNITTAYPLKPATTQEKLNQRINIITEYLESKSQNSSRIYDQEDKQNSTWTITTQPPLSLTMLIEFVVTYTYIISYRGSSCKN